MRLHNLATEIESQAVTRAARLALTEALKQRQLLIFGDADARV